MAGAGEAGAAGQGNRSWLTAPLPAGASREMLTWIAVAVGVVLRVHDYSKNRSLYMDERSLLWNLVNLSVFDFHTTLGEYQLAPPGFLVVERLLVRLPFDDVMTTRALPLLSAIASLFLMRAAARRYLPPRAVPIAVGLFALSDWLIYYSGELKQYSSDLALTLAAFLIAAGPSSGATSGPREAFGGLGYESPSRRRLVLLGAFGAIGVWFSYPLAFVLAGVGTYLFATAILGRDRRGALGLVGVGIAWAASMAVCYVVSHGVLDKGRFIWDWWDFAFLPLPPRSIADLRRDFWQIANVFDSPADVKTPLGPIFSAIFAMALAIAGSASLLRRWPGGLYLLAAPFVFALAASALHQYPFHGRLLIFLVPSVHMLVAQGVAAITGRAGPLPAIVLGAFLLFRPASDAVYYAMVEPLRHGSYDSHGDLRPDLLDYLERIEAGKAKR